MKKGKVPKGYYKATPAQIKAICLLTDDCSAMLGVGDSDEGWIKAIRLIDRFLVANGLERDFT